MIPLDPSLRPFKQAEALELKLSEVYGEIGKVVIVGDGANWITAIKNNFANTHRERYIDQFHSKKYVRDMVGRNIKVDWKYLMTCSRNKAMFYLLNLVTDDNGEVHLKGKKLYSKVYKWFNSFKTCTLNKYPNSIEGIQSTQIAITLKNRRSFSKENIYKMLMINAAHYNKCELSFENNVEDIFELNHSNNIIKSLTQSSFSNLPRLEGQKTEVSASLVYIVHWDGKL